MIFLRVKRKATGEKMCNTCIDELVPRIWKKYLLKI